MSFAAPQGLSGAPLISTALSGDEPFCYGWIIQQGTLGLGEEKTSVGLAVSIETLLSVKSSMLEAPLAVLWNRNHVNPPPRSEKQLPDGIEPPDTAPDIGWPEV